jgi:hypothetical protein
MKQIGINWWFIPRLVLLFARLSKSRKQTDISDAGVFAMLAPYSIGLNLQINDKSSLKRTAK